jgi:hypothetical protein
MSTRIETGRVDGDRRHGRLPGSSGLVAVLVGAGVACSLGYAAPRHGSPITAFVVVAMCGAAAAVFTRFFLWLKDLGRCDSR